LNVFYVYNQVCKCWIEFGAVGIKIGDFGGENSVKLVRV